MLALLPGYGVTQQNHCGTDRIEGYVFRYCLIKSPCQGTIHQLSQFGLTES